jgi:hypothetical protein
MTIRTTDGKDEVYNNVKCTSVYPQEDNGQGAEMIIHFKDYEKPCVYYPMKYIVYAWIS